MWNSSSAPMRCRMTPNVAVVWRNLSIVVVTASLCMLAQQLNSVEAAYWGSFSQGDCWSPGYRKWYSRLWDIKGDWKSACGSTHAWINSVLYMMPDNCVDKGFLGMWGEWQVQDSSCNPHWGSFKDDGCKNNGCRQYSSILWDIPGDKDWTFWCERSWADINEQHFDRPTRCISTGLNMWGEFDYNDERVCGKCFPTPWSPSPVAVTGSKDGHLVGLRPSDSPSSAPPSYAPSGSPSSPWNQ